MQVLQKLFEVGKEERLVLLDRSAQRAAELIAREAWRGCAIEEVAGVEDVVPHVLVKRSVQLVGARLGDDQHLRTRPFAILRAVGIAQQIEFAHRIHAEHLLADAARLHVVLRRAGKFNAVQKEQILLRPVAFDHEIVAARRIRDADAAELLKREIDHARIERKQQIVASAVERQVRKLLLPDEARAVYRRGGHHRCVRVDGHLFARLPDFQAEIECHSLTHREIHSRSDLFGEARFLHLNLILARRQGRE